ncbi:MAG: hypothetical protein MJ252_13265 [archaeon]|nr:hypothetical protein [archaeon]
MESHRIHGLEPNFIENKEQYQSLIAEMRCPMCLEVVLNPLECKICNTLLCENCFFILKLANKGCANEKCQGKYAKANKYVREILRALKVTCAYCQAKGMNYEGYIEHLKKCEPYLKHPVEQIIREIKDKDIEIEKANEEMAKKAANPQINLNPEKTMSPYNMPMGMNPIGAVPSNPMSHSQMAFDPNIMRTLVTNRLTGAQKMELYKCCTEGRTPNFAVLIERKGYPILEEISAKNFGWTPLHYGMHYGKLEIVDYILGYLQRQGTLYMAMKLRSSDNRTPLLCLLRSSNINPAVKKEIFIKLCNKYKLEIDNELKTELRGRKMEDMLSSLNYPH